MGWQNRQQPGVCAFMQRGRGIPLPYAVYGALYHYDEYEYDILFRHPCVLLDRIRNRVIGIPIQIAIPDTFFRGRS